MLPLASHLAQSLVVTVPVELAAFVVLPVKERFVTPATGTAVAVMEPVPEAAREAPLPMTRAAEVFVPPVRVLKDPPADEPQGEPASMTFPLASHFAQSLAVGVPVVVAMEVPVPLGESPLSIC